MNLTYLPLFRIWPNYDPTKEIFYLQEFGSFVNLHSNINYDPQFAYYCVYGLTSNYVTKAVFD